MDLKSIAAQAERAAQALRDMPEAARVVAVRKFIAMTIEEARRAGAIGSDNARLATAALNLDAPDAMLANRLVVQGSDPASLENYLGYLDGRDRQSASAAIMRAHHRGPGCLNSEERRRWLVLASQSRDEAHEGTVFSKVEQFMAAVDWLRRATSEEKEAAASEELHRILDLPYEIEAVAGVVTRVYTDDSGFAAAYWSGHEYAAVRTEAGDILIGSSDRTLEAHGFDVSRLKMLSPTFGILEKGGVS
jgi:hypothetical protein